MIQLFLAPNTIFTNPNNGDKDVTTEKIIVQGALQNAHYSIISKDGEFMREGILVGNEIHIIKLNPGVYYIKTMTAFNHPQSFSIVK